LLHDSLLLEDGYKVDVVFTSRLKRAIRSSWILLKEMNESYLPVFKSWRLNERMYGALTGLSKTETAVQMGAELVQEWLVYFRRTFILTFMLHSRLTRVFTVQQERIAALTPTTIDYRRQILPRTGSKTF
jgi:bisphosphoglycerate-dependent phosphoglycerate mutase family 1